MKSKSFFLLIFLSVLISSVVGQTRPDAPPRDGDGPPHHDWTIGVDANRNGTVEADEFEAAIDRTFAELDRNANGVIERNEAPPPPPHDRMGPPPGGRMHPGEPGSRPPVPGGRFDVPPPGDHPGPPAGDRTLLPPFFFDDALRGNEGLTRADFGRAAREVFASMDANHDGVLSLDESRPPRGREGPPPPPPNALFVAAELRFGDKLVKNQPFSAETVSEDTHRLFDGTTVTKRMQGALYRDAAGRTRREQPFEMIGGASIGKPQMLVFINDFATNTQYFIDLNNKVARTNRIGSAGSPRDREEPADAKTESLGTKTIEGVSVEGTRITFEIPAGELGNDKPLQVVTETWFSAELQMIVMSKHTDPLAGEHIFKLINIKRAEPASSLFTVPAGFRIEGRSEHEK